jgi:ketopantoate reductase
VTERKHILIVGAGAIGGLYAATLAKIADVAVLERGALDNSTATMSSQQTIP